jgi:hypothetical protein
MVENKKLDLKEEADNIKFECSNPNCSRFIFKLDTDHLNGYGELACPSCFGNDIRVIFLKYKKVERKKIIKSNTRIW